MNSIHDVAVIGAGPGGSAAAHYMARQGLDVVLLDKFEFPRDKTCGDGLTPRAVAVLADMGLLGDLMRVGCRVSELEIVAPDGTPTAAPIPGKDAAPGHTLIVPRRTLDNAIRERAIASGAKFQGRFRVQDVERGPEGVVIRGDPGDQLAPVRARLAVIACGASVKLLLRMGVLTRRPLMMVAARAYFEGVRRLSDRIQLRFDGVPLPGYGWVFPLSASSANVGAGFFPVGRAARRMPATPKMAFDAFIQIRPLQAMLDGARRVGPVKGHPLRVDFLTAPTSHDRVLLVGEAAGLVNPLTGEGIDYALESGKLAAEHLVGLFETGDLPQGRLEGYDRALRERFARLFRFCTHLRDWFLPHPFLLNRLVRTANRRPDLKMLLINIGLGNEDASKGASIRTILKVALSV